ncbi:SusD/RagB family nutrient-binding outer membrane lipoprotein [Puteibacter caeruleilacunae]|nr:SusD/RagB family nutrient-binding outer membrane lipoprotein [Puteibacter caeruleilacunae]
MKKLIYLLIAASFFASCDKGDFADMNQNPSNVKLADLTFLFTEAINDMDPQGYTVWFYDNGKYELPWAQAMISNGGNSGPDALKFAEADGRSSLYSKVMPNLAEIRFLIDNKMTGVNQAQNAKLRAVTLPVQIFVALHKTDVYGSLEYSEAMQGKYTNPPMLTPKLDTQAELFNLWINELNEAVSTLTSTQSVDGTEVNSISLGGQDLIYDGDYSKWAKFANSLKLRIAARLLHQDKAKAIAIAEEAFNNPAGLILSTDDELRYFNGIKNGHFGSGLWLDAGGRNLINFLTENLDPRVRFAFDQNDFNSRVVQQFLNKGKALPPYIADLVELEDDGKTFKGWKGAGEPWVRFHGAPLTPDLGNDPVIKDQYFNSESFKITVGDKSKTFSPTSRFNEKHIRPHMDLAYPDSVGGNFKELKNDDPAYRSVLFSAAEVNLFLAEFKLLGANITGDANTYFQNGITESVKAMDWTAKVTNILNYDEPYDVDFGVALKLKDGEIAALLQKDAYKLTGDANLDLEKVYIQQYISYLMSPNELFVTARRAGIPKTGSTILPRESFAKGGVELTIPRRFGVGYPGEDNINFDNIKKAIEEQGFSAGNKESEVLNKERIWYDKGAPAWGAGPNY